jgi:hypothetical protein
MEHAGWRYRMFERQSGHHADRRLFLESRHHLFKHRFTPALIKQTARLSGSTNKDLERVGTGTPVTGGNASQVEFDRFAT